MFVELTNTRLGYLFLQTCFPDLSRVYRGICATSNDSCGIPNLGNVPSRDHNYPPSILLYTRATKKTRIYKGYFLPILLARVTRVTRLGVCFRGYTCLGGKIIQKARENT